MRQVLLSSRGLSGDIPASGCHTLKKLVHKPVHFVVSSLPRLDTDKSVDERISCHLILQEGRIEELRNEPAHVSDTGCSQGPGDGRYTGQVCHCDFGFP